MNALTGNVALAYLERLDCDMRDGQFVARSVVRDEALTDLRALLARAEAAERDAEIERGHAEALARALEDARLALAALDFENEDAEGLATVVSWPRPAWVREVFASSDAALRSSSALAAYRKGGAK